jgi:hypothetical protein
MKEIYYKAAKECIENLKRNGLNPKITIEGLVNVLESEGETEMGYIYKLKSEGVSPPYDDSPSGAGGKKETDLVYIGSTNEKLSERLKGHKSNPTKNSEEVVKKGNISIELLETFPFKHKYKHDLYWREVYWQEKEECINRGLKPPIVKEYKTYKSKPKPKKEQKLTEVYKGYKTEESTNKRREYLKLYKRKLDEKERERKKENGTYKLKGLTEEEQIVSVQKRRDYLREYMQNVRAKKKKELKEKEYEKMKLQKEAELA